MKRAVVIGHNTFTKSDAGLSAEFAMLADSDQAEELRRLRDAIATEAGLTADEAYWCWIDVPSTPRLDEDASLTLIKSSNGSLDNLNTFFPTPNWVKSYAEFRVFSHVFAPPDLSTRRRVAAAAADIFQERFGFTLNPSATFCIK